MYLQSIMPVFKNQSRETPKSPLYDGACQLFCCQMFLYFKNVVNIIRNDAC